SPESTLKGWRHKTCDGGTMNVLYALALGCILLLTGCASGRPAVDLWADATVVAEQRAVIDEQRRTLDDLERTVGEVQRDLRDARTDLDRAVGETKDLRELFDAIDAFVREIIGAERRLEELQRPDSNQDV
ncbi:MAG: hypothetical protein LBD24_01890, partial [Spirochaetaceae bacterium]|nr:hypothetical protein [Spirochaetaceae bacterium]